MHPHLFQFGHLVVPTFGVLVALGFVVALAVCLRSGRLLGLPTQKLWNLALLAAAVSIFSAKLLLAALYWRDDGVRALALGLGESGIALPLGILIAIGACWLYARHAGLPLRRTADALAPALALLSSIAAIGCLEAGCGYGTPSNLPWAIVFTGASGIPSAPIGVPLHPTELYSAILEWILFVLLLRLLHRPHGEGEVMGAWLFLSGLGRALLAGLRGDAVPLFGGLLTVTELGGALMVIAGGLLWLRRGALAIAPAPASGEPHAL
ncbi:MAG TPA: prolipoprotein diacylglyceryl transferase family protein [Acidobacteriaceae bacterium]|nr:prolipoprotein diacylglyceryl transferase family protein [Acidobacteriaceae bacterium]